MLIYLRQQIGLVDYHGGRSQPGAYFENVLRRLLQHYAVQPGFSIYQVVLPGISLRLYQHKLTGQINWDGSYG